MAVKVAEGMGHVPLALKRVMQNKLTDKRIHKWVSGIISRDVEETERDVK